MQWKLWALHCCECRHTNSHSYPSTSHKSELTLCFPGPTRFQLQLKQRIAVMSLLLGRSGVYFTNHPHQYPSSRKSFEINKMIATHWWETEVSFILQEFISLESRWLEINLFFFPSQPHTCFPKSPFPKAFEWLCLSAVLLDIAVTMDLIAAIIFKYLVLLKSVVLLITAFKPLHLK